MKIYFCFIYFFVFTNKICLIQSFTANGRCIVLTRPKYVTNSGCEPSDDSAAPSRRRGLKSCHTCEFNTYNVTLLSLCQKTRGHCLSFIFLNNSIFEEFFQQYPNIVDDTLREPVNDSIRNTLFITFKNYDFTQFSFKYLSSVLNMNSPSFYMLNIYFIQPIHNKSLIPIVNDFSDTRVKVITLTFSCNYHINDSKWVEYWILPTRNDLNLNKSCSDIRNKSKTTKYIQTSITSSSSTTVSDIINITSNTTMIQTTFFERQKLYYLIGFPFILVCLIIIFLYICFQYYCQKKPEDLNVRLSIDSFDTGVSEDISSVSDKLTLRSNQRILHKFIDD